MLTMPARLRKGLVAYWAFDDAAGATRKADLYTAGASPASFALADHATVASAAGPSSNLPLAAGFTAASSHYLDVADSAYLSLSACDVTITGWYYFASIAAAIQSVMGQLGAAGQRWGYLRYNNATDRVEWLGSSDGTALTTVTVGSAAPAATTWYFIAMGYRAASGRLWARLNTGNETAATGTAGGLFDATGNWFVGAETSTTRFLDGRLAHWGIWRRDLANEEILWLYNNGTGRDLRRGC